MLTDRLHTFTLTPFLFRHRFSLSHTSSPKLSHRSPQWTMPTSQWRSSLFHLSSVPITVPVCCRFYCLNFEHEQFFIFILINEPFNRLSPNVPFPQGRSSSVGIVTYLCQDNRNSTPTRSTLNIYCLSYAYHLKNRTIGKSNWCLDTGTQLKTTFALRHLLPCHYLPSQPKNLSRNFFPEQNRLSPLCRMTQDHHLHSQTFHQIYQRQGTPWLRMGSRGRRSC